MTPSPSLPMSKVYQRVRHYGHNDAHLAVCQLHYIAMRNLRYALASEKQREWWDLNPDHCEYQVQYK